MATPDVDSQMRHSLRGCMNALKLGASVLDDDMPAKESLEFLGYMEQAADKMVVLIDQWHTQQVPAQAS